MSTGPPGCTVLGSKGHGPTEQFCPARREAFRQDLSSDLQARSGHNDEISMETHVARTRRYANKFVHDEREKYVYNVSACLLQHV